mmetsp:Transcript_32939/g.104555  ORF Transcript_32939/g.104555 Transcript_32939/m.104555 type:complete len:200 (+) Transcript_32939:364-963(+)
MSWSFRRQIAAVKASLVGSFAASKFQKDAAATKPRGQNMPPTVAGGVEKCVAGGGRAWVGTALRGVAIGVRPHAHLAPQQQLLALAWHPEANVIPAILPACGTSGGRGCEVEVAGGALDSLAPSRSDVRCEGASPYCSTLHLGLVAADVEHLVFEQAGHLGEKFREHVVGAVVGIAVELVWRRGGSAELDPIALQRHET